MEKPETREIPPQKILETVGKLHVQLADCIEQNKQLAQQNQSLSTAHREALTELTELRTRISQYEARLGERTVPDNPAALAS